LNVKGTALIVVDIQNDFCHKDGTFAKQGLDVTPLQKIVPEIISFIDKVRKRGIPIIFSKQIEANDISPENLNRQFKSGKLKTVCAPNSWGADFYLVQPKTKDIVLEKNTYDLFSNPQLQEILNKNKVKMLIVVGVNTDICIDTTVRRAFTEGYFIIVPYDLVATVNVKVHKHFLKIFNRFFGEVMSSQDLIKRFV